MPKDGVFFKVINMILTATEKIVAFIIYNLLFI